MHAEELRQAEEAVKLRLLQEQLASLPGAASAASWTLEQLAELEALIRRQKGVCEDRDVGLLSEVKRWFKQAGMPRLDPREAVVKAVQAHLWPKALPRGEDIKALQQDFLRAAQQGSLFEAQQLLAARPSVLSARSGSKGYTAMHFAAMAGALPMLDWLCAQGLPPEALSTPPGHSPPVSPAQVAAEYGRDAAVLRLRQLHEGASFLRSAAATDDEGRLRAAAAAGSAAAAGLLLRRQPGLAARAAVAGPSGALVAAAAGGHVDVLRELLRCGGAHAAGGAARARSSGNASGNGSEGSPREDRPLEAAVAAGHAEAANLLHAHALGAAALQLGSWSPALPPAVLSARGAPLSMVIVDAKLARRRDAGAAGEGAAGEGAAGEGAAGDGGGGGGGGGGERSVVMDVWEPVAAACTGAAPGLCRGLVRWVEATLGLPVWLPVEMALYLQLEAAVPVAIDACRVSPAQREALLPLATSGSDALQRLSAVLPYAHVPDAVGARCRAGLEQLLGKEAAEAQWAALEPCVASWLARLLHFLPATPWGERGVGGRGASAPRAAATEAAEEAGGGGVLLQLVVFDALAKAPFLYYLFAAEARAEAEARGSGTEEARGHEARGGGGSSSGPPPERHSSLPFQPDEPSTCPFAPKPASKGAGAGEGEGEGGSVLSYAAVLLLLAPVCPSLVRRHFPHVLQLGGGLAAPLREVLGSRLLLRLASLGLPAAPRWVCCPAIYHPGLALALLGRLGGPEAVLLRQPHAGASCGAHGGGEVLVAAAQLDEVLLLLLGGRGAAGATAAGAGGAAELLREARFVPEGDDAGSGVLLVEEVVAGAPLPRDGAKGWFDPSQTAFCVQARMPRLASLAAADAEEGRGDGAGGAGGAAAAVELTVVLGGACRFPPQPLRCAAAPQRQHLAERGGRATVPLGEEMARGAFAARLPLGALLARLQALDVRLLLSHLLQPHQPPAAHLAALAVLGAPLVGGGARRLEPDEGALRYSHYEYFGRAYTPLAYLWAEHVPLLAALAAPAYAARHGAQLAQLVQRRLLLDVTSRDLSLTVRHAQRQVDHGLVALHRALERSDFGPVAALAREATAALAEVARSGELPDGEPVANQAGLRELVSLLQA